jgi:sialic acid synthase SpsE
MQTLAQTFGIPVGYSDHTEGTLISAVAAALGATVVEKHFTLSRRLPGPDHKASLEPDELARMVTEIRTVERSLGDGIKGPTKAELAVREVVRRSVTLRRAVRSGTVISNEDLILLRPGGGILPREMKQVIGKVAGRDLAAGQTLRWTDLEP